MNEMKTDADLLALAHEVRTSRPAMLQGLDQAVDAKMRLFADARARFERQQKLRSAPRKAFWQGVGQNRARAERKQRQLEGREQSAFLEMQRLAQEVKDLEEMRRRVVEKIVAADPGK